MRRTLGVWLCLFTLSAAAQTPIPNVAQDELSRLQELVEAGAMPRSALQRAQQALTDRQDEATLKRTLYGNLTVDDLTREQADEMIGAAQRQFDRQQEKVNLHRKLVDEGVAARTTLTPFLEDLDSRRRTLDLAHSRARLLEEIALMLQAEELETEAPEAVPSTPSQLAERFHGNGIFTENHFKQLLVAFYQQFSRPLPVSARGETALHRSMGFDHRGRVDVALQPDDPDGLWLRQYMERAGLPYFAFRAAIPGKATGAHIHLGPPSLRLRAAD